MQRISPARLVRPSVGPPLALSPAAVVDTRAYRLYGSSNLDHLRPPLAQPQKERIMASKKKSAKKLKKVPLKNVKNLTRFMKISTTD